MSEVQTGTRHVPTYCYQCVAGPDLLTVKVVDGVATEVEPNFCAADVHPGGGKVCVKAYGLVQKTYNPHRVLTPMRRTNPKKGRDEDPGFVPISWDEALDLVAAKLNEVRAAGLTDASGYPRLAVSLGGAGTPQSYMGTFPAFLGAWGPVDMGFGSGQGVKCYHSEHLYGEFWHRAFTVSPDTPHCEYLISCGANVEASGGVVGVWRHANARVRGMKRVQVEPHLSVTGACSAEWVPIRPKTDAAFLYALLHVLLHEIPRERLDIAFLGRHTASPYLVGPSGYYLRDRTTRKPLVWDTTRGTAAPHDAPDIAEALEGRYVGRRCRDRPRRRRPRRGPSRRRNRFRQARRAHGAVFAGVGGADLRRRRRDDPQDRERVHRSRARRRNDRDRGHASAVPSGRGQSRQDREQRLGRLRVRLGAHAAGRARRRSRSARRHARHDGAAESPGSGARRQRARGSRRLHGLSAQSDRQGALVAESEHPQCVPDDGAARGERPVEPGARTDAFLVDVPGRDAEGVAAGDAAGRLDRLPDQSRDLVLGHGGARTRRWRVSRSWWRSRTPATRPTTMRTCCCPRRPTSKACS